MAKIIQTLFVPFSDSYHMEGINYEGKLVDLTNRSEVVQLHGLLGESPESTRLRNAVYAVAKDKRQAGKRITTLVKASNGSAICGANNSTLWLPSSRLNPDNEESSSTLGLALAVNDQDGYDVVLVSPKPADKASAIIIQEGKKLAAVALVIIDTKARKVSLIPTPYANEYAYSINSADGASTCALKPWDFPDNKSSDNEVQSSSSVFHIKDRVGITLDGFDSTSREGGLPGYALSHPSRNITASEETVVLVIYTAVTNMFDQSTAENGPLELRINESGFNSVVETGAQGDSKLDVSGAVVTGAGDTIASRNGRPLLPGEHNRVKNTSIDLLPTLIGVASGLAYATLSSRDKNSKDSSPSPTERRSDDTIPETVSQERTNSFVNAFNSQFKKNL